MEVGPRTVTILRRVRWVSAILCLLVAYKLFHFGVTTNGQVATAASLIVMFGFIVAATMLLLPETVPFVSRPFTAFIDGIYGTGPGKEKPPFDCRLARGYVKQERYEDAVDEYARVMKYHPKEMEPYRESIQVLLNKLRDREGAEDVLDLGLRKLGSEAERTELLGLYRELGGR